MIIRRWSLPRLEPASISKFIDDGDTSTRSIVIPLAVLGSILVTRPGSFNKIVILIS